MDKITLQKAIDLDEKIKKLNEALESFEWEDPENSNKKYSRNPQLIIESDDGDDMREEYIIPFALSEEFIEILKAEIKKKRDQAVSEFNAL